MKKLCVLFVAVVLAVMLFPQIAEASAPIVGGSGATLPKDYKMLIENHNSWFLYDQVWQEGRWQKLPPEKRMFIVLNTTEVYRAITDRFNLRLFIPFYAEVDKGQVEHHFLLGDVILNAKWRLYKKGNFHYSLTPGLSFATGDKRLRPFDSDKSFIDVFAGYNLSADKGPFGFHQYILYWNKASDIPDFLQYNMAVNIAFIEKVVLCLEWNGKDWLGKLDGKRWNDICFGLQYYPTGKTPYFEFSLMKSAYNQGGSRYGLGVYAGMGFAW